MLACLLGCGYSLHRDAPWGQRRQPKAHSPASTQAGCIPTSFSSKPTPSPSWQKRAVIGYIEEHLDERVSLVTLARLARLSQHHFCRAFKQSFGIPPQGHLLQRRMERAKVLLSDRAN